MLHIFAILFVFFTAQPATPTSPAVPAHSQVLARETPSTFTHDDCEAALQIVAAQLAQDPKVSYVVGSCVVVPNKAEVAS